MGVGVALGQVSIWKWDIFIWNNTVLFWQWNEFLVSCNSYATADCDKNSTRLKIKHSKCEVYLNNYMCFHFSDNNLYQHIFLECFAQLFHVGKGFNTL